MRFAIIVKKVRSISLIGHILIQVFLAYIESAAFDDGQILAYDIIRSKVLNGIIAYQKINHQL